MSDELDKYEAETGISVPIHVDAASGGFVAPFAYPQYEWDFQIPRVHSINASGHKYGMSTFFLILQHDGADDRYRWCRMDHLARCRLPTQGTHFRASLPWRSKLFIQPEGGS